MTDMKLVEEQQEFVRWLKQKGVYNPMDSGLLMQEKFQIWKLMKDEQK